MFEQVIDKYFPWASNRFELLSCAHIKFIISDL